MSSKRRSKVECINISDDDSASDQPPVKSKKRDAEQVPSPEVVELQRKVTELQQKNAELEKNFQGACRIAGEDKARVQFLENLIDTKPNVVDGAKNTKREDELQRKNFELTAKLAQYEGRSQLPPMQQPQLRPMQQRQLDPAARVVRPRLDEPPVSAEEVLRIDDRRVFPLRGIDPFDVLCPFPAPDGQAEDTVDDEVKNLLREFAERNKDRFASLVHRLFDGKDEAECSLCGVNMPPIGPRLRPDMLIRHITGKTHVGMMKERKVAYPRKALAFWMHALRIARKETGWLHVRNEVSGRMTMQRRGRDSTTSAVRF